MRSLSDKKDYGNEKCEHPPKITWKGDLSSIKRMRIFTELMTREKIETFQSITHFENVINVEEKGIHTKVVWINILNRIR